MDFKTSLIVADTSLYSILVPLLVALIFYRRLNWEQKTLFVLILISIGTEVFAYPLSLNEINNLFLSHIFTVIEFAIIAVIYRKKLLPIIHSKWMSTAIISFIIFAIINTIFFEPIDQFNNGAKAIESLLIIFMALLYFYKLLKQLNIKHLERDPMFWINNAFLVYFSASLFIFIFSNYIAPSVTLSITFWTIHSLLTILKNCFYAVALWIKPPKTT